MIGPQKDVILEEGRKEGRPMNPFTVHIEEEHIFISSSFSKLKIGITRSNPLDVSAFRAEEVPVESISEQMETSAKNCDKYAVEYIVGMCEIESIPLLVAVTKSIEVHSIDTLVILKIEEVAFIPISTKSHPTQSERQNEFEEQKDRMGNVLKNYGYYSLLSNISATFYSMTKQHFTKTATQRGNTKAPFLINDRKKREEFSFNFRLVTEIEAAANSPLWSFDIMVGTVAKLRFEHRDLLVIARRITTPPNSKLKTSGSEVPRLGAIREDGHTSKFCEIELIEKRGDIILTKVVHKGNLNLHLKPLDEKKQRIGHLISQLQQTQGEFSRINIVHMDEKKPASQLLKEDLDDPAIHEMDENALLSEETSVNYQAIKQAVEAKAISKHYS